jgi:glycosyltransferase involved in cell wall biosynthesis
MGISVIIPAYNAGRLIDEAIESVLRQQTPADEIIVINDGSTDRDYSILEKRHHSIRVINQPNRGVSAARNVGCEMATHDYIAVLDADDFWLPGKLHEQMRPFTQNPNVDAVFCLGRQWTPWQNAPPPLASESAAQEASPPEVRRLYYSDFLCSFAVYPSTMVVKRSAWRSIGGYDEDRRYGEDWDFYLRLSHGHQIVLVDRIAMLYRKHTASATASIQHKNHWADVLNNATRTLGLTDKFGNQVNHAKFKQHLFMIHFMHGYEHFWSGNFQVAQQQFARAAKMRPLAPRAIAYLALSYSPCLRNLVQISRPLIQRHQ